LKSVKDGAPQVQNQNSEWTGGSNIEVWSADDHVACNRAGRPPEIIVDLIDNPADRTNRIDRSLGVSRMAPIFRLMSSGDLEVFLTNFLTSFATTAKPSPSSQARGPDNCTPGLNPNGPSLTVACNRHQCYKFR
jgi:hypothetical protein